MAMKNKARKTYVGPVKEEYDEERERELRRRYRRRTILIIIIIVLLLLLLLWFLLFRGGAGVFNHKDVEHEFYGPFEVLSVVDGDTIVVKGDEGKMNVRMIGIDAPESVHPIKEKNTPEGEVAAEYTRSLLEGKYVYLELDEDALDQYGRTLAYVWDENHEHMYEEPLLKQGYAKTMSFDPNTMYDSEFEEFESEARRAGAGFWGTGFFRYQ